MRSHAAAWGPVARRAAGPARWFTTTAAMLLGASLLVFAIQELVPGDPALTILSLGGGPLPNPAQVAAKRQELGLDAPFASRYLHWLGAILHGDLGRSWAQPADVADLLGPRIATTLWLAFLSIALALALITTSGVLVALRPGGLFDAASRLAVVVMIAIPSFVLGLLLLQFVVIDLGIGRVLATPGGAAILPALLLAVVIAAGWSRPFRAIMHDVASGQAVLVARARGMSHRRALVRIALPAALLEFTPFVGLAVGGALGATTLVEVVFSWPGAAAYAVEAARGRDLPVIQAFTLISVAMFRLSTEVMRAVRWGMDPRMRARPEGAS